MTPPSFSALLPHLTTARFDPALTTALLSVGVIGSYAGARLTSLHVSSGAMKRLFGVLILVVTSYKLWTLVR